MPRFDAQQLVQLHSGAAQYAIPLTSVTRGALSLPVTLAYSYSGLRVSQPNDLVGLGWTLQAGASITRQVSGLVDDGFLTDALRRYHPDSVMASPARPRYQRRAFERDVDTAPDVYSFSLPTGVSGRFVILDTTVVLLPRQPVYIRRVANDGFQVTTEDGVRFLFLAREITTPSSATNYGPNMQHVSTWHLSRLISADAADTLTLHYTAATVRLPQSMNVTTGRYYTGEYQEHSDVVDAAGPGYICGSPADYTFRNVLADITRVRVMFLDSITARGACLRIRRQRVSQDSIQEIRSVQWLTTLPRRREVRRWTLVQSHFYDTGTNRYRLRLDSLRESANGVRLPAYGFNYLSIDVPPTDGSAAQDYWGFFNGAIANGDRSNMSTQPALLADTALFRRQGMTANREPDFSMVSQGALHEVVFPTGGRARWEYELNRIAAMPEDIPTREQIVFLSSGYDSNHREWTLGTVPITHPVTSSPVDTFTLAGPTTVSVLLHREPWDTGMGTGGTNQVRDFSIWRLTPRGDSLITTGAQYKINDGEGTSTKTFMLPLQPGRYTAQVHCEFWERESDINVRIPYVDSTDVKLGLKGPGIRVWRTTVEAAGAPPLVHTYRYGRRGYSSGVSLLRDYGRGFERQKLTQFNYQRVSTGAFEGTIITSCEFWDTSSDNRELGDEFSKYVHYYHTVEEENSTDNGLIVHYFGELSEQFNDVLPFGQTIFRRDAANRLQLAETTWHTYDMQDAQTIPFLRVRRTVERIIVTPNASVMIPPDIYTSEIYYVRGSFAAPVRTEQTRYGLDGHAHTNITRSAFAQQRLIRTATRTSTGWNIQRVKRLLDYAPTPATQALLGAHHFNPVVETQAWRRTGSTDSVLVGGQLTYFDPARRQPASLWTLRLPHPIASPNNEQLTGGQFAHFKSDTRYRPDDSVRYDPSTGLLQQRQRPKSIPTAYVWGYNRSHVVAQVENATYAQVLAVLGQPVITQLLGPNPGSDAQVRQLLAPLRTQLPQARVTTYTFTPLVGLTSQTDPSGRTMHYEYDSLGRLLRVRDEQGRLLTEQEYHYARP